MLFRNTLAQSAGMATGYLFSFLLAPFMLARLGIDAFGVWAVTGALATYAGLADFGVTRSVARFIAVFHARRDERSVASCMGLGVLAVAGVTLFATAAAIPIAPILADDLGVLDAADMRTVLLCSVGIYAAQSLTGVLAALPIGMLEMVAPSVAGAIGNAVNFGLSIAALAASDQLTVYAFANVAAAVVGMLVMAIAVLRMRRPIPLRWPHRGLAREVLSYGVKQQIIWGAELISSQTDKVIVAVIVGPAAAGAFEIGNRVALGVRSIAILAYSAFIPTVAAELQRRGREIISEYYAKYLRSTTALVVPLYVLAMVTAPYTILAWLGEVPEYAVLVLVLVSAAYLLNSYTGMGSTIANGDGRPGLVVWNSILEAGVNLALTLALAPLFGVTGVLVGSVVALAFGAAVFVWRFHRSYGLAASTFLRPVRGPTLAAIGFGLPLGAIAVLVGTDDRLVAAGLAVAMTVAYAAAYWPFASRRGWLPERLSYPPRRRRAAPTAV